MNKNINNIIENSKDAILIWENVLKKYDNELSFERNQEEKIKSKLFWETFYIFFEMLKYFMDSIKFYDEWGEPYYQYQFNGINVNVKSRKLDCIFTFGIYDNEFFLDTFLPNPKDMHKVSDKFWLNILELNKYGKFYFQENETISMYNEIDVKRRYKSNSNIFNMIKNFIFLDLSEGNLVNMGLIGIKWSRIMTLKELIKNGYHSFELLYRINNEIKKKDILQ